MAACSSNRPCTDSNIFKPLSTCTSLVTQPTKVGAENPRGCPREGSGTPPLKTLLVVIRLRTKRRLLHLHEELDVALGLPDLVGQEFQALLGLKPGQDTAQLPHDLD